LKEGGAIFSLRSASLKVKLAFQEGYEGWPKPEDENKFMDVSKTVRYFVEEYFIVE
jgi:hypothetical protein